MKTKNEIIEIIKTEGEVGAESDEKYIEIYDEIFDDGLELAQLVFFNDTNELLAYMLDCECNGSWKNYDELEQETRNKIENLSIWE